MKKLSLALITGGALCAFGVLLGGAALAVTGFEFSKVVTTMKYENKTAAYEPSLLAGIEIAAEDLKVVVSPSPDEQVHLSYWESALDATTIEVDGRYAPVPPHRFGLLAGQFHPWVLEQLRAVPPRHRNQNPGLLCGIPLGDERKRRAGSVRPDGALLRRLPLQKWFAGAHGYPLPGRADGRDHQRPSLPRPGPRRNGRITNTNARIRVSDTQLLDTVLQTDNGSVLLHNLTVRSLTAKNKNASLEAEALAAVGRVELETTNASLTAIDVQSAGDLSLRSKNGSVRATNCSASAFFAGTTNAKVDLARCKAAQVQAETSNGSVEIDRLDSRDITLISSNGGIRGSVLGQEADYVIAALTTNGSNNLTDRVGDLPGRLTVRTTNASIHVTFTE